MRKAWITTIDELLNLTNLCIISSDKNNGSSIHISVTTPSLYQNNKKYDLLCSFGMYLFANNNGYYWYL